MVPVLPPPLPSPAPPRRAAALLVLTLLGAPAALAGGPAVASPAPASSPALDRVWHGVEEAQRRPLSACGTLTETKTSPLLVAPRVSRGRFCAAGQDRFRVDYGEPHPVRVVYNRGALNVSTDAGRHTEALDVGSAVARAQEYFSGPHARRNLERDFAIEVAELPGLWVLRLRPVGGRIARRVERVEVRLDKQDFLPRHIEIDGRSGVDSIFDIRVLTVDAPPEPGTFDVYRPGARP